VSLLRVGFIPIPEGAKPGFDHADIHRAGRRMYVAHMGADREPGAHTSGWEPDGRCVHVFCPQSRGAMLFEERL
jgi:hypothetical protein